MSVSSVFRSAHRFAFQCFSHIHTPSLRMSHSSLRCCSAYVRSITTISTTYMSSFRVCFAGITRPYASVLRPKRTALHLHHERLRLNKRWIASSASASSTAAAKVKDKDDTAVSVSDEQIEAAISTFESAIDVSLHAQTNNVLTFPTYIHKRLRKQTIDKLNAIIQNITERQIKLSPERLAYIGSNITNHLAIKLVRTPDERISVLHPHAPRVGDVLEFIPSKPVQITNRRFVNIHGKGTMHFWFKLIDTAKTKSKKTSKKGSVKGKALEDTNELFHETHHIEVTMDELERYAKEEDEKDLKETLDEFSDELR